MTLTLFSLALLVTVTHGHQAKGILEWVQLMATTFNLTYCWICEKESLGTITPPLLTWLQTNCTVNLSISYTSPFPNEAFEGLFLTTWREDMESEKQQTPWSSDAQTLTWLDSLSLNTSATFPLCFENATHAVRPELFLGQLPPSQCKFTFKVIAGSGEEHWNSSGYSTLWTYKYPTKHHMFLRIPYPSPRRSFSTTSNQPCSAR